MDGKVFVKLQFLALVCKLGKGWKERWAGWLSYNWSISEISPFQLSKNPPTHHLAFFRHKKSHVFPDKKIRTFILGSQHLTLEKQAVHSMFVLCCMLKEYLIFSVMTLDHSITSTADTALWETGASDIIMIYANPFNVHVSYLFDGQ